MSQDHTMRFPLGDFQVTNTAIGQSPDSSAAWSPPSFRGAFMKVSWRRGEFHIPISGPLKPNCVGLRIVTGGIEVPSTCLQASTAVRHSACFVMGWTLWSTFGSMARSSGITKICSGRPSST